MSPSSTPLRDYALRLIRKPVFPLAEEARLNLILKARLTKKEYKIFLAHAKGEDIEQLKEKLKLNQARYQSLCRSIEEKLNKESIKQQLYQIQTDNNRAP